MKKNKPEKEKPSDSELLGNIPMGPVFNQNLLDEAIAKASINLKKIQNVEAWIDDLKADDILPDP